MNHLAPSVHITSSTYNILQARIVPMPGFSSLTVQQAIRDTFANSYVNVTCTVHPSGTMQFTLSESANSRTVGLIIGHILHVLQIPISEISSKRVIVPYGYNVAKIRKYAKIAIDYLSTH